MQTTSTEARAALRYLSALRDDLAGLIASAKHDADAYAKAADYLGAADAQASAEALGLALELVEHYSADARRGSCTAYAPSRGAAA